MGAISRLVRRNGLFYYRMATPRRLAAQLGRRELKLSLRTRDPLEAHEAACLRQHVDQLRRHPAQQIFPSAVVADAEELVAEMQTISGVPAKPDREAMQRACDGVMRAQIENAPILAAPFEGAAQRDRAA